MVRGSHFVSLHEFFDDGLPAEEPGSIQTLAEYSSRKHNFQMKPCKALNT